MARQRRQVFDSIAPSAKAATTGHTFVLSVILDTSCGALKDVDEYRTGVKRVLPDRGDGTVLACLS